MLRETPFRIWALHVSLPLIISILNYYFTDYSPRTIAGPLLASPVPAFQNRFDFFPIITPRTPVLQAPSLDQKAGEANPEAVNNKMDEMLDSLKKEIVSNTEASKPISSGRGPLAIETESTELPKPKSEGGLNLNIDLINDSYPGTATGSQNMNTNTTPTGAAKNTNQLTPNLKSSMPFSPGSLFMPRARNTKAQ